MKINNYSKYYYQDRLIKPLVIEKGIEENVKKGFNLLPISYSKNGIKSKVVIPTGVIINLLA